MTDHDFDPTLGTVATSCGQVRGDHARGAYRFLGIPYAAPPIGTLRFAPPQAPEGWTGVRDATGTFPQAPQPPDMMTQLLGPDAAAPPQSEADCLTLHVWTPAPDGARRPVMVWIHGGAFTNGSGTIPWYDGAALARRDVVVVTVNYRLGALGFLHLADLAGDRYAGSGNVGLLDQAAALGWVRDNIEAFGGDPANVTIFGESAGGMSVGTHLALPASKGLFHRAIAESGAASNASDPDRASDVATRMCAELGVEPGDVDALRAVPIEALLVAQSAVGAEIGDVSGLPFQPVVDGTTLPDAPLDAIRAGSSAGVDLLTGTNLDEMRLFFMIVPALKPGDDATLLHRARRFAPADPEGLVEAYRSIEPDATPDALAERISTDLVFRIPALRMAQAHQGHGSCHVYEFHHTSTAFGGLMGSTHALEIPFVFDNLDAPGVEMLTGEATEATQRLAANMADTWTTFARTGTPHADGLPEWPQWRDPDRMTMILDVDPHVAEDPTGRLRPVWESSGI
ncbi:MAG: carboxylesterase family protein [Actinobacteria bacterium]|nr:carboxylesterase family protein [Actinomycetota bacterium]